MLARKCRKPIAASAARTRPGLTLTGLVSDLLGAALTTAILVVLLWQGAIQPGADGAMHGSGLTHPMQGATPPEIALSSSDRITAKAGEEIDFPIAIDLTDTLPSRSLIAISAMPDGASFSEGRPYGATGWSLRPDEIGELRFRLPQARSGAFDMRIELIAADGAVLAESETRLNVAADPAEANTVSALESSSLDKIVQAEEPKPVEALPFPPQRKPTWAFGEERICR